MVPTACALTIPPLYMHKVRAALSIQVSRIELSSIEPPLGMRFVLSPLHRFNEVEYRKLTICCKSPVRSFTSDRSNEIDFLSRSTPTGTLSSPSSLLLSMGTIFLRDMTSGIEFVKYELFSLILLPNLLNLVDLKTFGFFDDMAVTEKESSRVMKIKVLFPIITAIH